MQEYVLNAVDQYYLLTLLTYPFKCCTLLEVIGCWFWVNIVFPFEQYSIGSTLLTRVSS